MADRKERPEFGSEEWWAAEVDLRCREGLRLRVLIAATRAVLSSLGLTLTGIEVACDRGDARRRIFGALEARDAASINAIRRDWRPDVIVDLDGVTIREREDHR